MSIALRAEREAVLRYADLAEKMRDANNTSAAALFERMVAEEKEHEQLLLEWMKQEGIKENKDIAPIKWRHPQISTTYDDEAKDPYQSSPYRALAFAVHNEEIAFRFYTHVAAESENEAVRQYAEVLAREELGHAALLRAERRRAYHAERKDNTVEPVLDPRLIHSEADLLTAAIYIDNNLLNTMNSIAENTAEFAAMIETTRQEMNSSEDTLGMSKDSSDKTSSDTAEMLTRLKQYNNYLDKNTKDTDSELQRLWACCDRSFVFYDNIVESASNEDIMLTAQKLTATALDRIGVLKQVYGDLHNN